MAVGAGHRFVSHHEIRVVGRQRPRASENTRAPAIVAAAPIRAGERAEGVGVLAGDTLASAQDGQCVFPRATPRQRHGETNAGVDVGGVGQRHRAERRFRFGGPAGTKEEPRQPQLRLDVGGIDLHNPLEESDGFSGASGAGEIFSVAAIGRGRLGPGGQHERGGEQSQHVGA